MKKTQLKKEPNLNIFFTYNIIVMITGLVFYPLFPLLLNYPPGSINTQFDIEFSRIPYYQQYIFIVLIVMCIYYLCFKLIFKKTNRWKHIIQTLETGNIGEINRIRQRSFRIPQVVLLLQIMIPVLLVSVLFIILGFNNSADIKFFLILTAFLILAATISYLFSKKYFRKVLIHTYTDNAEPKTIRFGLPVKILFQILPLFLLSILFTSMLGQSSLVKEKGKALFTSYKRELLMNFGKLSYIQNEAQIKQYFNRITTNTNRDIPFYIDPTGKYQTKDHSTLSEFFLKYTKELAFQYNGHTYDYYGSDVQGAVVKLPGVNGDWIFGIRYEVVSSETNTLFIINFIALFILAVIVILYFAKTISDDIALISSSLMEIAEGENVKLENKIPVISSDEIGDLVIAFNRIQEREKQYIQEIKENHQILLEKERLAMLGQLIGGIAHNLQSPLGSLTYGLDILKDLAKEYQQSIGDEHVTKEDHYEIAREMIDWFESIKPYCSYMSDLITTIREQAVPLNTAAYHQFTVEELVKRIELLLKYELKNNHCIMEMNPQVDLNTVITGEINNLVQVCNNLIINGIQAYDGNPGKIEFTITRQDNRLLFTIRDHGKGIPPDIQNKLLHQIITTKGKNGTGLGLYMSYLMIKGYFHGDLYFESVENKGSVFYISIPVEA